MNIFQQLRRFSLVLCLALTVNISPTHAEDTLRLAHFVMPDHIVTKGVVEPFTSKVDELSKGTLTIEVFPAGELGVGPVEQYNRVLSGVADIVWGLPHYTASQFPLTGIIEYPGVIPETSSGSAALWRAFDDYLSKEFVQTRPLALWTSSASMLFLRDIEVHEPSDLKGLKILVPGIEIGQMMRELGATPIQMPMPEAYTALQTGLIDGIITDASAVQDFRINEVANVILAGAPFGQIGFYLLINDGRYQQLDDAQKAAIDNASGAELSRHAQEVWQTAAEEVMDTLRADPKKTVITLTPEQVAAFKKAILPARDKVIAEMDAKGLPASDVLARFMDSEK